MKTKHSKSVELQPKDNPVVVASASAKLEQSPQDFKIPEYMIKEIKHFVETGIPRCVKCKQNYIKRNAHTWQPTCECFKGSISIG